MRRKGSGRTKGAGSFVATTLEELNRVLKPDAIVVVSRRYAEQLQLNCNKFQATTENIASAANQIEFAVSELEPIAQEEESEININVENW
jgi:hypothetical protein